MINERDNEMKYRKPIGDLARLFLSYAARMSGRGGDTEDRNHISDEKAGRDELDEPARSILSLLMMMDHVWITTPSAACPTVGATVEVLTTADATR
jgi:hypothetical protein